MSEILRDSHSASEELPILSICIATYNRGNYIGQTLNTILDQIVAGVEIVVVDGASPDNTAEVMKDFLARSPFIRYYKEGENSGIDRDYDKAVKYAKGEYCWLMTDDDLLRANAVQRVLKAIKNDCDVVVVDAEVRNADLSVQLEDRRLKFKNDRKYGIHENERFFLDVASHLSFIGGTIIRRNLWLSRDRESYYGTLFIHMGVIFQHPPLENIVVLAEPLVTIRYGNAMWTPRGLEIWLFKWPQLIWGFVDYSESAKIKICHPEPWRKIKTLMHYRALGAYSRDEYKRFFAGRVKGIHRLILISASIFPPALANLLSVIYLILRDKSRSIVLYDLLRSRHANVISRWFAAIVKM